MNKEIMNINAYIPIILAIILTAATVILLLFLFRAKKRSPQVQIGFLQSLINDFKPTLGMEKNLDFILRKTQELVEAPNYSFYIYNSVNNRFTLKAVRQLALDANIAPSYSGLVPYEKEKYDPPLSLSKDRLTERATVAKEGEVPILTIPIKGGQGLIQIGPVTRVASKTLLEFEQISELLEIPLRNLIEEEEQRRNYEVLETSSKAIKYINRLYIHEKEYIKLIAETCLKSAKPSASMIIAANSSFHKVIHSTGLSKQIQENASQSDFLVKLKELTAAKAFSIIEETSTRHSKLNQLLSITASGYYVICQFTLLDSHYFILFAFEHGTQSMESMRNLSMKMLWSQIQQLIQMKQHSKQNSIVYIDFLKSIAAFIDQLSPFTTGSSKLMSNYSMAIAREMGLSEYQIQTIGLAAYLSNIGVIGISDGLLGKDGIYSDEEYEQMKLHSEVGAAIIENTIALDEVALLVKHHHERMDGNGYPSRMMGEEIPVGSRIISVVQTFLAKINGRSYREPLPFDEALKLIMDSAGSQLDSKIVTVFMKWYETKRNPLMGKNKALGNCWELSCVPSSICSQCPAYKNTSTQNCWEFERNNCRVHGKTCETCFVYSEAMSRLKSDDNSSQAGGISC
ncbi:HD domain-containing protein [Bacillus sp. BRMEA1]|uniref:HD-GYP domain-containing protein n=1 Tax=Neobacillus endophyticus TaxID=2738405 RepID=UPI0015636D2C|nr:HD domain-containing phosphohydrolase [Neobacillus endophyticus]NRD77991.1 HD domain-containing protein [Neobacillus endophyticus]